MERLTIKVPTKKEPRGYILKLPPIYDKKAQDEFHILGSQLKRKAKEYIIYFIKYNFYFIYIYFPLFYKNV